LEEHVPVTRLYAPSTTGDAVLASVTEFKKADDFAENIRDALDEGQEPALSFAHDAVYSDRQSRGKLSIHITKDDVDWTKGMNHTHCIVIGSENIRGGEQLVIKDSNFDFTWTVASIDVLVPPKVRVSLRAAFLSIMWAPLICDSSLQMLDRDGSAGGMCISWIRKVKVA
jgi:hypothetical protein